MKMIFRLRKHHYIARFSIFLIVLALIAGTVNCTGAGTKYDLTVTVAPQGSGNATDLANASPYTKGTAVVIQAIAAAGYQFVNWSAPAGTFTNADAAQTTFTMPAQDVRVTANFLAPLDHFAFYATESDTYIGEVVYLEDQFGAVNAIVESAMAFGNPVEKVHDDVVTPISHPDYYFTMYSLAYEEEPQEWFVEVDNQFGTQQLMVSGPVALAVPTQKAGHEPPVGLDHYLLYLVNEGPSVEEVVSLNDEFGENPEVYVYEPILFASPVRKTHGDEVTEIVNPEEHAVIYLIDGGDSEEEVQVINQFGEQTLHVYGPVVLAVPSQKRKLEPPEDPLAVAAVLGDYNYQLIRLLWDNNILAEKRGWDVIADIGDYDVVVVNEPDDPGSTDFQAFLDAASDNGVGVVFTSSYSIDLSWGISLLERYSGGPSGQGETYGLGDVYYKVTQEHPIFDGWDVGDEITIITGGDGDHAWFSGYSGNTIAGVGSVDVGMRGDAVAVGTYGGSTHVLLASLGPQSYTDVTAWTNDGKTVFINAVCFAAGIP